MASARASVLRHLTSFQSPSLRTCYSQRRWAQVHDIRFLATTQHSRSVIEKYREKLERKAREEGLPDIDALKKAHADKIETLRKKAAVPGVTAPLITPAASETTPPTTTTTTPPPTPKVPRDSPTSSGSSSSSGVKPLSSILDLPKALALPPRELTAIWRLRHAHLPNSLCAVIPAHVYGAMDNLARAHPQFVLPIPHPEQGGAEMHFLQWTWDAPTGSSTVLFTSLAEYKLRGEFAQPHTTITHHTELSGEKGVVLMQGSVMDPEKGVKVEQAQWLVMCLQKFYGGWDGVGVEQEGRERAEVRRGLLEGFARGDAEGFSLERLLEEAERV
ncbi:putative F1F0 ATP synthase assembly protein Atp11 [Bombardia bombarda]|uniref:F1F0 ATP synthase assembly protein Atp11 n=1 Tax=Bombardia bombarda TaxID=252184 RepID=A0AA39WM12_9PEZI|nr:putative F1F0 ATP synthase assembly protein Atp11 [Bombardia bombarda]